MPSDSLLDRTESMRQLLHVLDKHTRLTLESAGCGGLSQLSVVVLTVLGTGVRSPALLCSRAHCSPAQLGRTMERLVRAGWLEPAPTGGADLLEITLTERGQDAVDVATAARRTFVARLSDSGPNVPGRPHDGLVEWLLTDLVDPHQPEGLT